LFSSSPLAALIRLLLPLSTLPSPENSNKKPTHTHTPNNRELLLLLRLLLLPLLPNSPLSQNQPTIQPNNNRREKDPKTKKNFQKPQMGRFQSCLSKASEEEWKNQILSLTQREKQTTEALVLPNPRNKKKLPRYYRIKHTEPAKNRKKGKGERGSNPPTTTSSSSP
jgi:hypothetical protein